MAGPEFLPGGSLYLFIGVASVLFTIMLGCFMYHKGKSYFKKGNAKQTKIKDSSKSLKRLTRKNKFSKKKGKRTDEEDRAVQSHTDTDKAKIDAKYNNHSPFWSTEASAESATSDRANLSACV